MLSFSIKPKECSKIFVLTKLLNVNINSRIHFVNTIIVNTNIDKNQLILEITLKLKYYKLPFYNFSFLQFNKSDDWQSY